MPNVEEWWPLKRRMESGQSTKGVSAVSEIFVHFFFFFKSVANNIKWTISDAGYSFYIFVIFYKLRRMRQHHTTTRERVSAVAGMPMFLKCRARVAGTTG